MKNKITKEDIENLAYEIIAFLTKYHMANDVRIYFNGKAIDLMGNWVDWPGSEAEYVVKQKVIEDINPKDYLVYVNPHHILSMSFEGPLYDELNYEWKHEDEFWDIFKKYGVLYELGETWNLTCYKIDENMEVETTEYIEEEKPIYLINGDFQNPEIPWQLRQVMEEWWKLSKETGDIGSCVLGAGFKFNWNDKKYFMNSQSPWQGSCSWEKWVDTVKVMLQLIEAEDIQYNWGTMD